MDEMSLHGGCDVLDATDEKWSRMAEAPPWQRPSSTRVASSGRTWRLWLARRSQLPRVLGSA